MTEGKSIGGKFAYAFHVLTVRLRFIGLLVAVMLVAAYWDDLAEHARRWTRTSGSAATAHAGEEFFCPMHPQVVREETGTCPICGMPLSPRTKGVAPSLPDGVLARVQLSPYRVAQGGIRTSVVEWRPLAREIETAGTVEFDERRLARIAARFPGRIESLAVDFTGTRVEKGGRLATLYSPEILAAQDSLLAALRGVAEAEAAAVRRDDVVLRAKSSAAAARQRLVLWGLSSEQLDALVAGGVARPTVELLAPIAGVVTKKSVVPGDYVMEGTPLFDVADLSSVWLVARVHEDDSGLVAAGQRIEATVSAHPGRKFEGTVAFVAPTLDRTTRTVEIRADLANDDGALRPGMFAAASVLVRVATQEPWKSMKRPLGAEKSRIAWWCPMHPEVVRDAPGECEKCGGMELERKEIPGSSEGDVPAIPESAVVDTGRRKVVYVETSPGVFDAKEIVVGPRCGAWYPVVSGVEPGARVATAGSFLLDAETRLDPSAAAAYFGAKGSTAPAKDASK